MSVDKALVVPERVAESTGPMHLWPVSCKYCHSPRHQTRVGFRPDRYRCTEWAKLGEPPVGVELYDHKEYPDENVNLAGQPEHKDLIAELSKRLHAGWRARRSSHVSKQ